MELSLIDFKSNNFTILRDTKQHPQSRSTFKCLSEIENFADMRIMIISCPCDRWEKREFHITPKSYQLTKNGNHKTLGFLCKRKLD